MRKGLLSGLKRRAGTASINPASIPRLSHPRPDLCPRKLGDFFAVSVRGLPRLADGSHPRLNRHLATPLADKCPISCFLALPPNDLAGFLKAGFPNNGGVWGRNRWYFHSCTQLTSAFNLAVALKAWFALAHVLGGEIAALRVLNTFPGKLGDLALVDICDRENIRLDLFFGFY